MTSMEALVMIVIAVAGAGGPVAVWITSREVRQAKHVTESVAESVGAKDGHGDLQSQNVVMLSRLSSIETTLDLLADSASGVTARLKQHDREISEHRKRLDGIDARLDAISTISMVEQREGG